MVLATTIPQISLDAAAAKEWAAAHPVLERMVGPLGLHAAYTQPLFVALMLVLAASTAMCAWERSASALRTLRTRGTVTEAQLNAVRRAEPLEILPAEESTPEVSLDRASTALRRMGLRVNRGPRLIEATSGVWGLMGSPVFHWALVALIILIPLGRLTRSEGLMGVVAGTSRVDAAETYGQVDEGPLHGSFTGLGIGVEPDILMNLREDGVDRGPAPVVTLSQDGRPVASGQVYPNHPLRYRSVTVHMSEIGVGAEYSLVTSEGVALTGQALIDPEPAAPGGYSTFRSSYSNADGETVLELAVSVPATSAAQPDERRKTLVVEAVGPAGDAVTRTVASGDMVDVGGGLALRIGAVDYYARLSVVDDWSVSSMYALLVLAVLAVSVSVLVPYRRALVLLDTSGERPVLRVLTRHSRGSPEFESMVRKAAGGPGRVEDR